jgi:hypothetical protein
MLSANVLDNSAPQDVTRFQFCSGSQIITTKMTIQRTWSTPIVPRLGCMLGLTLPAGLKIEIKGKRVGDGSFAYNLGGNSLSEVVTELDDGSFATLWAFDAGLTAIIGNEISIYNNLAGSTVLTASQEFEIGECDTFQGILPAKGVRTNWSRDYTGIATINASVNQQPHTLPHREARQQGLSIIFDDTDTGSWYKLIGARIARKQTIMVLPRWRNPDGSINSQMLHQSAIFGYCSKFGSAKTLGDSTNICSVDLEISEYPPK